MSDPIVSKPDHGEKIILQGNEGQDGMASPRLQLFFDDITLILNDLTLGDGGTIEPSDFDPSSVLYRPSIGADIFPAVIDENEFLGRLPGGEIEGLGFVDSWSILGNGTSHITLNNTQGANDFTIKSTTSSKMFVVQGGFSRVSIAKDGLAGTDGQVHILNSFAEGGPVTAHPSADDLVIEHDFSGGLSLLNGFNSTGNIAFGSPNWGELAGVNWFLHDIDFGGVGAPTWGVDVLGDTFLTAVSDQATGATTGVYVNPLQNADIDFQYNSVNEAPFMRIDQTGGVGRMGLSQGVSLGPTDGVLHIHKGGSAGAVTALTGFDHIVLEAPGDAGLTILGGEFSELGLKFGSSVGVTGPGDGSIVYTPDVGSSIGRFVIRTGAGAGASERLWIDTNEVVANPVPFFQSTAFRIGGSQFNNNFVYAKTSPAGGNRFSITDANIRGTQGLVHIIRQGLSLASAPGNGIDMIFDGSGNHGISFLGTDVEESNIHFVSPSNLNNFIRWSNANVNFQFFVNNAQALVISQGEVVVNDTGLATLGFRVESDTSNSLIRTVPTGAGIVGFSQANLAPTDGTVHIYNGDTSQTASTVVNGVVIEDTSETGLSILVPDDTFGDIAFGCPTWGNLGGNIYFQTDTTFTAVGLPLIGFDVVGRTFLNMQSDEFDGTSTMFVVNPFQDALVDFQVNTFAEAPFMRIEYDSVGLVGRMGLSQGVSFAPTDGILHIFDQGTGGVVTANTQGDAVVIESNTHTGLSLLAPADGTTTNIFFGNPTANNDAFISYEGLNQVLTVGVNAANAFTVAPTNLIINSAQNGLDLTVKGNTKAALFVIDATADSIAMDLVAVTIAVDDKVVIRDTSDSDLLKTVTAQDIADLAPVMDYTALIALVAAPDADWIFNESGGDFNWRAESVGSTHMMYMDAGTNRVSFSDSGLAGTDGTVHIINSDAGLVTALGGADDLVLEGTGARGLTILTDNATGVGTVAWGDPTNGGDTTHLQWTPAAQTLFMKVKGVNVYNYGAFGTTFNPDQTNQRIQFQSQTSTTMAIFNGANGKVGFSDASIFPTDGMVHIIQGGLSGSVSAPTASDGLVFESNGSTGLAFLVPVGAIVTQTWGDPGDNDRFVQEMDSNTNTMTYRINNQTLVSFDFTGGPGGEFVLNESGLASFDVRFESDNSLRMFYLDSSINMVSFSQAGIAGTDGTVHIINSSAGIIAADLGADELVIEGTGAIGQSFLVDNATGVVSIAFGDPSNGATAGLIEYTASTASYAFFNTAREALTLYPTELVFNEGGLSNMDTRFESVGSANMLFIDASANRIGIADNGFGPSDGLLHLFQGGAAGVVTANAQGDAIVIESSTHTGLSVLAPADGTTSNIYFGNTNQSDDGRIHFEGFNQRLYLSTATVERLHIDATEVVFNDTGADTDLRVESDLSTHMVHVDAGNNRVSISDSSLVSVYGTLHVNTGGSAGALAPTTSSDDFVISNSGSIVGMTLMAANNNAGFISFGDQTVAADGGIRYDHNSRRLTLWGRSRDSLAIDATGVIINDSALGAVDFRGESISNTHKFFLDSSLNTFQTAAGTAATALADIGGIFFTDVSTAGTTAVTTEETLLSYTLPLNSLVVLNHGVRIRAWGTTAANANNKTVKLKFGATAVLDTGAVASNGETWYFEADVFRVNGTNQDAIGKPYFYVAGMNAPQITNPTETLAGTVVIAVTGQNGTAAANDIVAEGFTVQYL